MKCRCNFCFHCHPIRHSMQPARQGFPLADLAGHADQDQKRCLKGIVDSVLINQPAATHGQHQRPMSLDQYFERVTISLAYIFIQELAVRGIVELTRADSAQHSNQWAKLRPRHELLLAYTTIYSAHRSRCSS